MKKIKSINKKQLMWVDDFLTCSDNISINNHNSNSGIPYVRYIQHIKANKLLWFSK